MRLRIPLLIALGVVGLAIAAILQHPQSVPALKRLDNRPADIGEIRRDVTPRLKHDLGAAGLTFGAPVFIRIFKESRELELWVRDGAEFRLFRSYDICAYSGDLGPKLREGDRQSPEGFYRVSRSALNPNSSYHLSFNLGFPNRYDRSRGRTGSYLMVHGDCLSIGCYAMTDKGIEEIYLLVEGALNNGQDYIPVHSFPFRMTDQRMQQATGHEWLPYWQNLKQGHDLFEQSRIPPQVGVDAKRYVFDVADAPRP
ncbi:MAG: hypothetical protein Alpg2KO_24850 [Alphaproteobacteria bacterium]